MSNRGYQKSKYLVLMSNHGCQKSNIWFQYITMVIKKSNTWFQYITMVIRISNTQLIYNHDSQFFGEKNHPPKTAGFFLVLPWNLTVLCNFWNTWTSAILWICFFLPNTRTQQVLILSSFKYPELAGITKIKYPPWTAGSLAVLWKKPNPKP